MKRDYLSTSTSLSGKCVLEIWKEGKLIDEIDLTKETYLLGRNSEACDIVLDHPSCSRVHARIDKSEDGLFITDLGSAQGSRVDGVSLEAEKRTKIAEAQTVEFGASSRSYMVRWPVLEARQLTVDEKKRRLWGEEKKTSDRDESILKWSAASKALEGDAARSDKFMALMGARKRKEVPAQPAADTTKVRQEDSTRILDNLTQSYDAARRRGFGRAGLG